MVAPIVPPGRGNRGVPGHLLDRGQVHAGVEQIAGPGPAQVMRSGRLDASLAPALLADRPGRRTAQALQLAVRVADQRPFLSMAQKSGPGSSLRTCSQSWRAGRAEAGTETGRGLRPLPRRIRSWLLNRSRSASSRATASDGTVVDPRASK
jgi:hypothetical protein